MMSVNQDIASGDETAEEPFQEVSCVSITFASWLELLAIADGSEKALVWLDEGRFSPEGVFEFNSLHGYIQPLAVDKNCALTMKTLHDALNKTNQTKFQEIVAKSRSYFLKLHDFSQRIT
jgi:hypothetical protein